MDAQAEYDGDPDPDLHDDDDGDGAAWVDRLRSGSRMRDVIAEDDDNDVDDGHSR